MKQILIVGADKELSDTLSEAIRARGAYPISQAMTVRESLLLVAQQKFDLVLTPLEMEPDVRRALQAIQPQLEVIAVASAGDDVTEPADGWGHTVISAGDLAGGLDSVMHSWQGETHIGERETVAVPAETDGEQTVAPPLAGPESNGSDAAEEVDATTWPTHASLPVSYTHLTLPTKRIV